MKENVIYWILRRKELESNGGTAVRNVRGRNETRDHSYMEFRAISSNCD